MSELIYEQPLVGSVYTYVQNVSALKVIWREGVPYLMSATGNGGGLTSFSITGSSTLTLVQQSAYGAGDVSSGEVTIATTEIGGVSNFVPFGIWDTTLTGFSMNNAGAFAQSGEVALLTGDDARFSAFVTVDIGGTLYAYSSQIGTAGVQQFTLASNGTLNLKTDLSTAAIPNRSDIVDFEIVSVGGNKILLAASQGYNAIQSYLLSSAGAPSEVTTLGANQVVPIQTPTALVSCEIEGKSFVILAASGSSSLTVFQVLPDGDLEPTDNIIDNLETRFKNVTALEVVDVNGQSYVIAAGSDDGISVFQLLPNGNLVHLDTVEDQNNTSLQNVSALEISLINDVLHIFASSESETGITHFTFDPDVGGQTLVGTNSDETLSGGAYRDVLEGGAGNDTISGNSGDDLLVDGSGEDYLSGGSGSDVFVLIADNEVDTITGYNAAQDSLDLSGYFMLYDASQLQVSSMSWGAIITFQNETIRIYSNDGQPLTTADFPTTSVLSLERPPNGFEYMPMTVEGTAVGEALVGGLGNDLLLGYGGDDSLFGDEGGDTLNGGTGRDTASYFDTYEGVSANLGSGIGMLGAKGDVYISIENLLGSTHSDALFGNSLANQLDGAAGHDTLKGGGGNDTIFGGGGNDDIFGGSGDDTLEGGAGDDLFYVESGHDAYVGGAGNDIVDYSSGTQSIYISLKDGTTGGAAAGDSFIGIEGLKGTAYSDKIYGGNNPDSIWGGAGNDSLRGLAGNDILTGGDGNDHFLGGGGGDTMVGGAGIDTADYSDHGGIVVVSLGHGTGARAAAGDHLSEIENIVGSNHSDSFSGTNGANLFIGRGGNDALRGYGGNDTLRGGAGADRIEGGAGFDFADYSDHGGGVYISLSGKSVTGAAFGDVLTGIEGLIGTNHKDVFSGTSVGNQLWGRGGNDILRGYGGNDTLRGGTGADRLEGGSGFDFADYTDATNGVVVSLGAGKGFGWAAGDILSSIEGILGSSHADIFSGTSGGNVLNGMAGNDTLRGYSGNDTLIGGAGADRLEGGSGSDTVDYGAEQGSVIVSLGAGKGFGKAAGDCLVSIENLVGSKHNDIFSGASGGNVLDGGAGNDTLRGYSGNDTLIGGTGADRLEGGAGRDTVDYSNETGKVIVSLGSGTGLLKAAGDKLISIENLVGTNYNDVVSGTHGSNVLKGGGGNDILRGYGGNDLLYGGAGDDVLNGGAGKDAFIFVDGHDVIEDFDVHNDSLKVSKSVLPSGVNTAGKFMDLVVVSGGNTIFDLGGGNIIEMEGVINQNLLEQSVYLF